MSELKHKYGKHPIYLQMPHELYISLNAYVESLGIPRSQAIFNILGGFLEPMIEGLKAQGKLKDE